MRFPSMDWVHALVEDVRQEPEAEQLAKEWGGRTVGVVVTAGAGLEEDFCVFARPHASKADLEELKQCEDEDDLELEEPDFFFTVPVALARQLLEHQADPFALLQAGKIRADGDLKFLIPFSRRWQPLGERVRARMAAKR